MHTINLDLDLLRSFAAVADSGSFTAAAERVARTQSAVSLQIKRLEQTLERPVFERTSRSLSLTPAGEKLLGFARRMLSLNDETLRQVTAPPVTGEIRLGITEYFVPGELPGILARFAAAYPGVHLEVRMGLSGELREDLAQGRLDAVIARALPRERRAAVWSEPQVWAAGGDYEIARGAPLALALLPAPCVLRAHAIAAMQRSRRPWRIAFTGSSMESVKAAVAAGLGVSILPRSCLLPGMKVLPAGRAWPDPGALDIAIVRGAGAAPAIVAALEQVARQTLHLLTLGNRPA